MFDKQTKKFCSAVVDALPEMDSDTMQGWIGNPKALQNFLRDLCSPGFTPTPKEETPLDTLIRVDRSVHPSYPIWMNGVIHPELELTGPAEYNLKDGVEEWLHDDQKGDSSKVR